MDSSHHRRQISIQFEPLSEFTRARACNEKDAARICVRLRLQASGEGDCKSQSHPRLGCAARQSRPRGGARLGALRAGNKFREEGYRRPDKNAKARGNSFAAGWRRPVPVRERAAQQQQQHARCRALASANNGQYFAVIFHRSSWY